MRTIKDGDPGRLAFMPKHFGRSMMRVEGRVFAYAGEALKDKQHKPAYTGGCWDFAEQDGAGWLIPPVAERVRVGPVLRGQFGGNVELSRESAGLALTIMATNHEWQRDPENDELGEAWHRLMEVAYKHPEARTGLMEYLD
jgi:hypothetical protein